MSGNPIVSIITIFYNAEKYLPEAVESVMAQTYPDWELLLIDDGSTDGSTAWARRCAAELPAKIRYFDHEGHSNLGKSTSRNLGIRNASGKYLVFLDADDVLLPKKIERQVPILEAQPELAMVYGKTLYWYSWTGDPKDQKRDYIGKLGLKPGTILEPPSLMTRFLLDGGMVPCLCSPLVRRQDVLNLGGFEESIQNLYEDQVFLAKVCLHGRVLVNDDLGERYRQHPESTSYRAIVEGEYDPIILNPARLAFLNWLSGYLSAKGIEDRSLLSALSRAYRPYRYPRLFRLIGLALTLVSNVKRQLNLS